MNRLFSFLGTNNYEPCVYERQGQRATETPFFQVALTEFLQSDGYALDEVVIFATKKAQEKNGEGFVNELDAKQVPIPYRIVTIVDMVTDQNIWDLFETVYNEIQVGDRLFFDITHGFRSFPITVLPILYYARDLKEVSVGGIYYGNYEARQEKDKKCYVPTNDLTDVLSLLDWTHGVNTFLTTGSASSIVSLVEQEDQKERRAGKLPDNGSRKIAMSMQRFSHSLETCRGVSFSKRAIELKDSLNDAVADSEGYRRPLVKLFDNVEEKMSPFTGDQIMDPFHAVLWCIDHGLTQQAYTMLFEHAITTACLLLGKDSKSIKIRNLVSSGLAKASPSRKGNLWNFNSEEDRLFVDHVTEVMQGYSEIFGPLDSLRDHRNDMNHAEHTASPISQKSFGKKIRKIAKELEPFFVSVQNQLQTQSQTASTKEG